MTSAGSAPRLDASVRSAVQIRTMRTALKLFSEHGVGGTSYQMIADALGVTKAAVYHQFKTKKELITAVAELELSRLEDALATAESDEDPERARDVLLEVVIDHAVEHRQGAATLLFDPAIGRALSEHLPLQHFVERLYGALIGDVTSPAAQVRLAMLAVAIGGTVGHPLVADVDDETLREQLLDAARRLVEL